MREQHGPMPVPSTQRTVRIHSFDGFRGIAMLLVLLYHAFGRWPAYLPYGNRFETVIPFKLGGVWLFFILSGFFTLMTLERSRSFGGAVYKRWLRLFPAMLIASILLLVTGPLLPERPLGVPEWKNAIPGLVFLHPDFIERITGSHFGLLEGSFWSLFVDMKFYLLFGLATFTFGADRSSKAIACLFLAWCGCQL